MTLPVLRAAGPAALAACLVLGPALSAWAAPAWWQEAEVAVQVHEHSFRRVTANPAGCQLRLRLHFDAPASKYADPSAERNHYRFRARVSFSGGASLGSEVFDNTEAGARVYAFSGDTSSEGCWAAREHALRKLDVHACRGSGCVPEPFE